MLALECSLSDVAWLIELTFNDSPWIVTSVFAGAWEAQVSQTDAKTFFKDSPHTSVWGKLAKN